MAQLRPEPAGFGNCGECAYLSTGPPLICQECAAQTLQPAAPYYCPVCGQALPSAQSICRNWWCSSTDRAFAFNRAIAMKTGPLDSAITRHKYDSRWGWGIIFARVLLGYLQQNPTVSAADLIIPMPTYNPTATERKGNDHTGWVIECAIDQDDVGYPFHLNPPVIVKTAATRRMVGHNAAERRRISEEIYAVLVVPDPAFVRGKTVVVFDDVFTAGDTLNAVGRRLCEAGADEVIGLTMARAPWR